jgi:hypothetical protein
MNTEGLREFEQAFLETLGDLLHSHGFVYLGYHIRPRGISLEFERLDDRIFASLEGGTTAIDLILFEEAERYWRVAINQAIWFAGVRAVASQGSLKATLELFREQLPKCCAGILAGNLKLLDERFCFKLTSRELASYLQSQGC